MQWSTLKSLITVFFLKVYTMFKIIVVLTNLEIGHQKVIKRLITLNYEGLNFRFGQVQQTKKYHSIVQSPLRKCYGREFTYIFLPFFYLEAWGGKLPISLDNQRIEIYLQPKSVTTVAKCLICSAVGINNDDGIPSVHRSGLRRMAEYNDWWLMTPQALPWKTCKKGKVMPVRIGMLDVLIGYDFTVRILHLIVWKPAGRLHSIVLSTGIHIVCINTKLL